LFILSLSNLYKKILSIVILIIISIITFSIFYITNNSYSLESENATNNDFNIIAVADVGCSLRAQENIKKIEKLDPELFLVSGDLSYKKIPDCWFNMTQSMDSKTKIAIGNHDDYEEEGMRGEKLKKSLMDHYNLDKSYYSFNYQNVHVLVMDTQLEMSVDTLESTAIVNETTTTTTTTDTKTKNLEEGKNELKKDKKKEPLLERFPLVELDDLLEQNSNSNSIEIPRKLEKLVESNAKVPALKVDNEQYQFVFDDLEKTSENKDIDWIFVMMHKPMYSSISKQLEEYLIRDKYQDIFDKYNVDLVIQGHNHIYSRTLPLSFNKSNLSQPIADQIGNSSNNNTTFTNPNGTIFLVVGTGGEELHRIVEEPYYVANQYNKGFGFVDLKIDGKRLDGVFYDINLNCNMEIITKKGREVIDFESCLPPPPTIGNNELKVIDHFSISK
jgi:3',5'-cyclic AMP phosphodiesterase CpdA